MHPARAQCRPRQVHPSRATARATSPGQRAAVHPGDLASEGLPSSAGCPAPRRPGHLASERLPELDGLPCTPATRPPCFRTPPRARRATLHPGHLASEHLPGLSGHPAPEDLASEHLPGFGLLRPPRFCPPRRHRLAYFSTTEKSGPNLSVAAYSVGTWKRFQRNGMRRGCSVPRPRSLVRAASPSSNISCIRPCSSSGCAACTPAVAPAQRNPTTPHRAEATAPSPPVRRTAELLFPSTGRTTRSPTPQQRARFLIRLHLPRTARAAIHRMSRGQKRLTKESHRFPHPAKAR